MTKILTHEFLTIVGPLLFVGLLYLGFPITSSRPWNEKGTDLFFS